MANEDRCITYNIKAITFLQDRTIIYYATLSLLLYLKPTPLNCIFKTPQQSLENYRVSLVLPIIIAKSLNESLETFWFA